MKPETINPPESQFTTPNSQFTIQVTGLNKRFNREWVFKNLSNTFQSHKIYAITGPNGSGKSTLMQVLWGQLPATSGSIAYSSNNKKIAAEEIYRHISIATPYMDLIEELTLEEHIRFHFKMRAMRPGLSTETIIDKLYLTHARHKHIANFSSGMKQRLKLGLAFYTEASALFLDEPGTNLDEQGFAWYTENLNQLPTDSLIFIATNQRNEYPGNAEVINMTKFKG